LVSNLKSVNIVNFLGLIAEDSQFGIILEFCENGSLISFLEKKSNEFSFKEKLKLLIDVSKGME
jgi:serine/threonine protein kinase